MAVIKAAIPSAEWRDVGLDASISCECSHPLYKHQTGSGAWTGFCEEAECKCEWPTYDMAEKVARDWGIPVERFRELEAAPRDEDGWPVGHDGIPVGPLTEQESFALQAYDTMMQESSDEDGYMEITPAE